MPHRCPVRRLTLAALLLTLWGDGWHSACSSVSTRSPSSDPLRIPCNCPASLRLFRHRDNPNHGDICRLSTGDANVQCPSCCYPVDGHPFCVARGSHSRRPCRTDNDTTLPCPPVMHTYIEELGGGDTGDIARMKVVWSEWWRSQGWTPRILTLADARRHPRYEALRDRFLRVPLGTNVKYDLACYIRYVAMAAVGGAWMSDYDTIPLDFPPSGLPHGGRFTVWQSHVPSLLSGSPSEWERIVDLLVHTAETEHGNASLFSDMLSLHELLKTEARRKALSLYWGQTVLPASTIIRHPERCSLSRGYWAVHFAHAYLGERQISITKRPEVMNSTLRLWKSACGQK